MTLLTHPKLGEIRGVEANHNLTHFYSLPYASIRQRFARSQLLDSLHGQDESGIYDATRLGPCSIQPFHAAKTDADSNQLPSDILGEDQAQSEDCLRVTITVPTVKVAEGATGKKLPVLVFLHGGAFFLNSGERPYYSPVNMLSQAIAESKPLIFVSVNYRLGALGFLHSSEAPDLVPANNGLHDQTRAFEWIMNHISGFGGDPTNVTAIGQSAGGESLSLHNISGRTTPLYNRSITLAGTPVTMPAKTPAEHEENFRAQAKKLGIATNGNRTSRDIAKNMIHDTPVEKMRELNFVGAPCTSSEMLPHDRPTMELSASGPETTVDWLESQIVSAAGYDGSISWIITKKNPKRTGHARSFRAIAENTLGQDLAEQLCQLYGVHVRDQDDDTLTKICQFESDIGFICAAEAVAAGSVKRGVRTYLQLFDLPNPFDGYLEPGKFSTHSWDIVALLGAYDERKSKEYLRVVQDWRSKIIDYCVSAQDPWSAVQDKKAMSVSNDGLNMVDVNSLPGSDRRRKLGEIAATAKGISGLDLLWEGVCRRWLDQGE
ncbi:hypothetical protein DOTSEDRAFT_52156 [Dothistroma septosporum NZE10]|uniref:Carboxylesterase type B domain-containing protein n=1 Tax=Dothistroma septosporum (strain NZE10 / CBS 128990) TaxID=675120 RepID=N1PWJ1_DOTSN|nr:hypothetical protein DOTSEDRAFT_52156 [Dothistroma septosporum NZE10]